MSEPLTPEEEAALRRRDVDDDGRVSGYLFRRLLATLDAERQKASEVAFDARQFAAVVVQRDRAEDEIARLRSQLLAERAARHCPCRFDAELGAGSVCPSCGHRDHGRSGCHAALDADREAGA